MLQWDVGGEECDKRCLHIQSKGVIVEVHGVQIWQLEERSEKRGKRSWDFGKETTSEDVAKICNLKMTVSSSVPHCHVRHV